MEQTSTSIFSEMSLTTASRAGAVVADSCMVWATDRMISRAVDASDIREGSRGRSKNGRSIPHDARFGRFRKLVFVLLGPFEFLVEQIQAAVFFFFGRVELRGEVLGAFLIRLHEL